jgi:murein DD-endopeptidase MepM/ murein hydrolase activator NlpD
MLGSKSKKRRFLKKLKNKYRLVIMNDDTFEERVSWKLTPLNVFVSAGIFLITFTFLLTYIIAFTPLREYIPGYADVNIQRQVRQLNQKVEDIKNDMEAKDLYIKDINNIVDGGVTRDIVEKKQTATARYDSIRSLKSLGDPNTDSLLLKQLEDAPPAAPNSKKTESGDGASIQNTQYQSPLQGNVVGAFDESRNQLGINIIAPKNTKIKSISDGTVISADWAKETGYFIKIKHKNKIVSTYGNAAILLKRIGAKVKAGEEIATVGDNNKAPQSPHLYFELSKNGKPVNPNSLIQF